MNAIRKCSPNGSILVGRSLYESLSMGILVMPALFFLSAGCGHQSPSAAEGASRDRVSDPGGIFVVDGNSHTQSRHGAVAMPVNVLRKLDNPSHLELIDVAHSGHGMIEIRVRAPTTVDPLYCPGRINLLLYWEGVHDLYEGFNAEQTFERIRQYGVDRKRTGFTVVTLSLLPGREATTPLTYERDRQTVNKLMRTHWREFADAFIDVGADPELGDPDAPIQGVYFSPDRVHMTDAGSERVAMLVADVFRPMLGH